jgi:hypothetical protein
MADLVEWLEDQLRADERAVADVERIGLDTLIPAAVIDRTGATVFFAEEVYRNVIAVLDPAAVLRTIAAHRAILDRHSTTGLVIVGNRPRDPNQCVWCADDWPCPDVRDLVSIYESRDGYLEEWKP